MEGPAGVAIVYSHDGLRVAVDGQRRGLVTGWFVGMAAITALWRVLVGPDLSAMTMVLWAGVMVGVTAMWPVAHSVVELHTHGVRVLVDGEWHRLAWADIDRVVLGEASVIRIDTADGVLRVPAGGSRKAARWLVDRMAAMSDEVGTDRDRVPSSLIALCRSGDAVRS
ncbi:MAG: hypothetical protein R3F61_34795 [Myxococcota bacterium]